MRRDIGRLDDLGSFATRHPVDEAWRRLGCNIDRYGIEATTNSDPMSIESRAGGRRCSAMYQECINTVRAEQCQPVRLVSGCAGIIPA
jgi:hypothetical protein